MSPFVVNRLDVRITTLMKVLRKSGQYVSVRFEYIHRYDVSVNGSCVASLRPLEVI